MRVVAFSSTKANFDVRSIAERVERAFLGADLGNVDVDVAARIGLETAPVWACREAGDAVALKAAMQCRPGPAGQCRL